jgi:hypothetical protein
MGFVHVHVHGVNVPYTRGREDRARSLSRPFVPSRPLRYYARGRDEGTITLPVAPGDRSSVRVCALYA